MTTAPASPHTDPVAADHATARKALVPVAVLVVGVMLVLSWTAANSLGESVVRSIASVVFGGLVFGLVVPFGLRKPSAGGRALALSIVGLVLGVLAWWSSLPLLFGAAGALLGAAGRRADRGAGLAIAALVIGLLAVVGDATMFILDAVWLH